MSDYWRFSQVFASVIVAIGMVMLVSPVSGAEDPVTSVLETYAYPQVVKSPAPGERIAPIEKLDLQYHEYRMAMERHRFFAIILLVMTALVAHFLLLWRLGNRSPEEVVTGTALIYIVFGTIVLVTLSDNKDQLTASMGILGAIAGYLFGRTRPRPAPQPDGAERAETPTTEN